MRDTHTAEIKKIIIVQAQNITNVMKCKGGQNEREFQF